MQYRGHFAVERRIAALVIADPFLVDPDVRTVIGRADMEEGARAGFGLGVEVALIPDHALVVEELRHLRVPVAGHFERRSGRKIVLLVVLAHDVGVLIHGVALVVDLTARRIQSAPWRLVDQVVPVPVQTGDGAMIDADKKRLQRFLPRLRTSSW